MKWGELKAMLDKEVPDDADVTFWADPQGEAQGYDVVGIHANVGDEVEVEIKKAAY